MASNALQVDSTHNSDVVGDNMVRASTQNKVVQLNMLDTNQKYAPHDTYRTDNWNTIVFDFGIMTE
jgi:hypothetical protein